MDCPDRDAVIEERIDRVLTQYRESPNLLGLIREDLGQFADLMIATCGLPDEFEITTAVGDQLTLVGKRLGWPRCHCICEVVPVFGFRCGVDHPNKPITGLCEHGVWGNCNDGGTGDICFNDDGVYRNYLLARRFQIRQLWDIDSLQAAAEHVWGPAATVINMGQGRVAIQPGRVLSSLELLELPVAFRVLPLAPGITPYISNQVGKVFGFGAGWGGLCESAVWFCPEEFDPYNCT